MMMTVCHIYRGSIGTASGISSFNPHNFCKTNITVMIPLQISSAVSQATPKTQWLKTIIFLLLTNLQFWQGSMGKPFLSAPFGRLEPSERSHSHVWSLMLDVLWDLSWDSQPEPTRALSIWPGLRQHGSSVTVGCFVPVWEKFEFCAALEMSIVKRSGLCAIFAFAPSKGCANVYACVCACVCVFVCVYVHRHKICYLLFYTSYVKYWFFGPPNLRELFLRKMNSSYCNKIFLWPSTNRMRK